MEKYSFIYLNRKYEINISKDSKLKTRGRLEFVEGIPTFRIPSRISYFRAKMILKRDLKVVVDFINRIPFENKDFIFIFGKKYPIEFDGSYYRIGDILSYKDEDDKITKLQKMLYLYAYQSLRNYEIIMGITNHYKLLIRDMKTRYGTNSRATHRISLSLNLIHYSKEMIDSVIVHELAHDKHFNHSSSFYEEVMKYCPKYRILNKKMKKGEYV